MNKNIVKKNILLVLIMLICFSCTKEKRSEVIKNEVVKEDFIINIANVIAEKSKYIINRRSGKVHSYSHGKSIVSERYQLESNDDSSKFATAVYYHYINKEILKDEKQENKIAYGIDLWETSSENYHIKNKFINTVLSTKKFDYVKINALDKRNNANGVELFYGDKKFVLEAGDLLYRKGHVEFYIGNNKIVNWGRVHNKYYLIKKYTITNNCLISDDMEEKKIPYKTIIRFKGE